MPKKYIPLRALHELTREERANLPISFTRGDDGKEIVLSLYRDEIWEFWPYIPQNNRRASCNALDWRIDLGQGGLLTDDAHAELLNSAKDFIWASFNDPVEGRQRPKMTTVIGVYTALISLLRWMETQGIRRFRDLQGKTLNYVPVARLNLKTGKPVATGWHAKRLVVLEDLYFQREKLRDGLQFHPWPHESASSLAGEKSKGRITKTLRIPERTVRKLVAKAFDYVCNRASLILDARDALEKAVGEKVGNEATAIRVPLARSFGFEGSRNLSNELALLRDACYIVIAMFSGIRDSEILDLKEGCIAHSRRDGIDLTWLHGTIFKTGVRPYRWLVPPVVETAVHVMERYRQPYAAKIDCQIADIELRSNMAIPKSVAHKKLLKRLDISRRDREALFLSITPCVGHLVHVVSGQLINLRLKHFCKRFEIVGENGKIWSLTPHQFRRTYAYFVASAELGDLHYLREHFGHWSFDMTLLYTDGATDEYQTDSDLLNEILRTKAEKQEYVFRGYFLNDTPLANGDMMLADLRRTIKTASNKEELIRQISSSVTLNGTGHSWCIGNVKGSGCGGLCVFEADMCVDCAYGIIGPEHLPVWKEIASQQQEALNSPDIGLPGKARSDRILAKANEVIAKIGVV